jgi:hypothetical protein
VTAVHLPTLRTLAAIHEQPPVSRWRFGSPCRFIRTVDFAVHVVTPAYLTPHLPRLAAYLRRTSPRWGRTWRDW